MRGAVIVMNVSRKDIWQAVAFWKSPKARPSLPVVIFHEDGVDTTLIPVEHKAVPVRPVATTYPHVTMDIFNAIAKRCFLTSNDFIYVEPDCRVLKDGWDRALLEAFSGKPLLPCIADRRNDFASGIGVYPSDTRQQFSAILSRPDGKWDTGFYQLTELVEFTDLIDHRYGIYDQNGDVSPMDWRMNAPTDEAVICHKVWPSKSALFDEHKDNVLTVSTEGDFGDVIYLMSILHRHGGPFDLLVEPSKLCKHREDTWKLLNPMMRLLVSQPYINHARHWSRWDNCNWRSGGFRKHRAYVHTRPLAISHLVDLAVHGVGIVPPKAEDVLSDRPWLVGITPSSATAGRIIINRTPRYNNPGFDWNEVVRLYGERLIFIGARHEWTAFCRSYGFVEYLATFDMLDAAEAIAGSEMFIGNQSSCYALAEGLKKRRILEVGIVQPDCIYPKGRGVIYSHDGSMHLPDIGGSGTFEREAPNHGHPISTSVTPPGLWRYPDMAPRMEFSQLMSDLAKRDGISKDEAKAAIIEYTVSMHPKWQNSSSRFGRVETALNEAEKLAYPAKH